MPATNPRISAVLDDELADWLQRKAQRENLSLSSLVRQILSKFFEEHEERYWVGEGERRLETFESESAIDHDEAWA